MIDYLVTQNPGKDQAEYVEALALELGVALSGQQSRADMSLLIIVVLEDKDGICVMIRKYLKAGTK